MSLTYPVNLNSVITKHQLGTNESNENMVRLHMDIPLQFGSSSLCTRLPRAETGNSGGVETALGSWVSVGLSHRWSPSGVCTSTPGQLRGFELQPVPVESRSDCYRPARSTRLAL